MDAEGGCRLFRHFNLRGATAIVHKPQFARAGSDAASRCFNISRYWWRTELPSRQRRAKQELDRWSVRGEFALEHLVGGEVVDRAKKPAMDIAEQGHSQREHRSEQIADAAERWLR